MPPPGTYSIRLWYLFDTTTDDDIHTATSAGGNAICTRVW
jgi:hypothetical protein